MTVVFREVLPKTVGSESRVTTWCKKEKGKEAGPGLFRGARFIAVRMPIVEGQEGFSIGWVEIGCDSGENIIVGRSCRLMIVRSGRDSGGAGGGQAKEDGRHG